MIVISSISELRMNDIQSYLHDHYRSSYDARASNVSPWCGAMHFVTIFVIDIFNTYCKSYILW